MKKKSKKADLFTSFSTQSKDLMSSCKKYFSKIEDMELETKPEYNTAQKIKKQCYEMSESFAKIYKKLQEDIGCYDKWADDFQRFVKTQEDATKQVLTDKTLFKSFTSEYDSLVKKQGQTGIIDPQKTEVLKLYQFVKQFTSYQSRKTVNQKQKDTLERYLNGISNTLKEKIKKHPLFKAIEKRHFFENGQLYTIEKLEESLEKICENGKGKMLPDGLALKTKNVLEELEQFIFEGGVPPKSGKRRAKTELKGETKPRKKRNSRNTSTASSQVIEENSQNQASGSKKKPQKGGRKKPISKVPVKGKKKDEKAKDVPSSQKSTKSPANEKAVPKKVDPKDAKTKSSQPAKPPGKEASTKKPIEKKAGLKENINAKKKVPVKSETKKVSNGKVDPKKVAKTKAPDTKKKILQEKKDNMVKKIQKKAGIVKKGSGKQISKDTKTATKPVK